MQRTCFFVCIVLWALEASRAIVLNRFIFEKEEAAHRGESWQASDFLSENLIFFACRPAADVGESGQTGALCAL